jgi:hypothetical protein
MNKTTKNVAPVGSLWMGENVASEPITVEVASDPVPGNDLRHVIYRNDGDNWKRGDKAVIGKNWFRRATRIA